MRTTRGVNIGAAVALGAVTALGQAPDPWAELTLPQPVAANALRGQGKLLTYDEGTTLHVYSSLTRTWHSTAKSVAAPMRLFNDCLVVIEPGFCRAFSAYTGSFADRVVAATAIVRNAGGHNNDSIVLVASGSELHAFSAFTGEWTTRTMGAGFGVSVERHTAMFLDGTTIGGMSAFDGQWREHVAAAPVTAMSADGTAAVCRDVNTAYGFSAHDPKWKTAPLPLGAAFDRGDDWALWYGGGGTLAFSGLTGQFASSNASPSAVAGKTDLYALLGVPSGLLAWSAFTGDFLLIPRAPSQLDLGAATALLHDGFGVRGYSAMRQMTGRLAFPAVQSGVGTTIAFATAPNGQCHVWSSYTAGWHAAPAGTSGQQPVLTTTTLALPTPTDCYAFDARRSRFVASGTTMVALAANPNSSPLLAHDASSWFAFDTDAGRWLRTPRRAPAAPPVFRIWRTTALIVEGQHAHGIGAQAGRFHHHLLPNASGSAFANSEVGYVELGNTIAACGMLAELVGFQQFPHFRRVQPRAATLSFAAITPAQTACFALFGTVSPPLALPGLGELLLSPATLLPLPAVSSSPGATARIDLLVPPSPALSGLQVGAQLLLLSAGEQPWLGELSTVEIW